MPSTHSSLHYHLVFSTKNREPCLTTKLLPQLFDYLGGVVKGLDGHPHAIGGVADHVHLLIGLKPTHCLADVMREVKSESSKWVKKESGLRAFSWQEGYGAFTVSAPNLDQIRGYVHKQEEHHRTTTFQAEYLAFLERGLVEFDDRYLW